MFGNIYGLDLGTYEIKVFDKKQDKICRERDVIAIKNKKNIFAIGDKAYEMYEKAPDDIEVVFPMKSGVIALLTSGGVLSNISLIARTHSSRGSFIAARTIPIDTSVCEGTPVTRSLPDTVIVLFVLCSKTPNFLRSI